MAALRVSVLASGELRLDDQPVTLDVLASAMAEAAKAKAAVWYYRENPEGRAPPPIATEVLKLITANKLPVQFFAKPDFSEPVSPATILDQQFARIRAMAARGIAILRPDSRIVLVPATPKEHMPPAAVASVEKLLSSSVKRNVAVLGETAWAMAGALNLTAANEAIPFFGMLMGFATLGHSVWVFNATASPVLAAACRDADVLIVDGERIAALPSGWQEAAGKGMRNRQILVHDRATFQLRKA